MKKRKTYNPPTLEQVSLGKGETLMAASTKYDGKGEGIELGNGGDSGDKDDFEINSKENWGNLWGDSEE